MVYNFYCELHRNCSAKMFFNVTFMKVLVSAILKWTVIATLMNCWVTSEASSPLKSGRKPIRHIFTASQTINGSQGCSCSFPLPPKLDSLIMNKQENGYYSFVFVISFQACWVLCGIE